MACTGVAVVRTSKSFHFLPSGMHRTAPATRKASVTSTDLLPSSRTEDVNVEDLKVTV